MLQEVFLLFYHKLPDLDVSTGKIEAWLLRVARNFSMSFSRTRTKQPITGISYFEPASMVNTEQDLQKKELHQKLDEFLDSLNETERTIFILHKIEGMKYKDLMKVFDISHRTLKRVVRSVLIKLKDRKLFDEEDFLVNIQTNFTYIDWLIISVYLGISLYIGIKIQSYVKDMKDFIAAGQGVGTKLGIATMASTEMGLVTIMAQSEKGYTGGFAAFHIALVAGIVTLLVGLSGFIVAKLREMNVLTIPEYYELRFNRKVRITGAIMLTLGGILNMGLFLKMGGIFIAGITGYDGNGIAVPIIMTILITLVLIYTLLGGMVSVIITDYIQFVLLSFGLILVTILAINNLGWDNIFNTIEKSMGAKGFDPTLATGEFGTSYIIWSIIVAGLVSCAIWPTSIARALAAQNSEVVKKQYIFSSIAFLIRIMIPMFLGICAFVFIGLIG